MPSRAGHRSGSQAYPEPGDRQTADHMAVIPGKVAGHTTRWGGHRASGGSGGGRGGGGAGGGAWGAGGGAWGAGGSRMLGAWVGVGRSPGAAVTRVAAPPAVG